MKTCTKCGAFKPFDEFRRDSRKPNGLGSWCKRCTTAAVLRRHAEYKARTGRDYRDRYRVDGYCADCGAAIRVRPERGNARCRRCASIAANGVKSDLAAERARRRRQLVPYDGEVVRRRPEPKTVVVRLRARWYAGYCLGCGAPFVHDQPQTRTCSPLCARRLVKDRRRARKRDAYVGDVSPQRIFERDRWTCQLCGRRVAWTKDAPHPSAPVIDHIVPLAAGREYGGVHAPYNVQCAHFKCNSIKRDLFAQAAMF